MPESTSRIKWLLLFVGLLLREVAWAQTGLQLTSLNTPGRTLTAAELAALPHQTQPAKDKEGKTHRYTGVPLTELLKLLQAPEGKALHGTALMQQLLVTGADGYQVLFALPELDPSFASQTVLLADRRDGQSLPAASGPYQIIVPQEKRPARWVRQVTGLRLLEVNP
ncbi:molybdopterin-binding protein [Hymenobacter sp.]|jgi:hypothetical protein|uniref:molybdopterin-binding protein n=1 Tax=Hymenobacter sp. TaxID=1898978 RepID=UPI002EDA7326